jgi:hypothetical protein
MQIVILMGYCDGGVVTVDLFRGGTMRPSVFLQPASHDAPISYVSFTRVYRDLVQQPRRIMAEFGCRLSALVFVSDGDIAPVMAPCNLAGGLPVP